MRGGGSLKAERFEAEMRRETFCIVTELRTGEQGRNRNPCKELSFVGTLPMDDGIVMFSVKLITSFPPMMQCSSVIPLGRI